MWWVERDWESDVCPSPILHKNHNRPFHHFLILPFHAPYRCMGEELPRLFLATDFNSDEWWFTSHSHTCFLTTKISSMQVIKTHILLASLYGISLKSSRFSSYDECFRVYFHMSNYTAMIMCKRSPKKKIIRTRKHATKEWRNISSKKCIWRNIISHESWCLKNRKCYHKPIE